jgi:hypothetical protein
MKFMKKVGNHYKKTGVLEYGQATKAGRFVNTWVMEN